MKRYCPECGETTDWKVTKKPEAFEIRGEEIEVSVENLACGNCGEEYVDMNSEKDPFKSAYAAYREKHGMVTTDEIRAFRVRYGLTQKELSELLGFGAVTLSRYENGALQDEAHDQVLKFIFESANLLKIIKEKPEMISAQKRKKLIERLESESKFNFYTSLTENANVNKFNGFKLPTPDKIIATFRFFTFSQPVYKTKLMKLFFYADFKHFKKHKTSITGLQYAQLPFGPVPEGYDTLLGILPHLATGIHVETREHGDFSGEVFISNVPVKREDLSDDELETLRFVQEQFANYSSAQIKEFSHKEKGYIETERGKLISYEYASGLKI